MTESPVLHCRLCAEPSSKEQLISVDDAAGINSKIRNKMLWINVDVSSPNLLPKSICFSCFDLLERTWSFLHNVRTAQSKLTEIYGSNDHKKNEEIGRPLDVDWEEHKQESSESKLLVEIKRERSCSSLPNCSNRSSDSEVPLTKVAQRKEKKKTKRKKKKIYDIAVNSADLDQLPLEAIAFTMSWHEYIWCCGDCDAQCKSADLLRLHALEIHGSCCSFKCVNCLKHISIYKDFIQHIRKHHKTLRHYCDNCNMYFRKTVLLKDHYKTHQNPCTYCGTCFETTEQLKDHIDMYRKVVLKDPDLKCDLCDREFKTKGNLYAHRLVHTERSREFACHVCGKMFFTKGALSTHMATHDETKPYKCEYCSLAFRARGNLTSHISMHSAARPFVCETCGKSFRVKRHLKSHSIIHTDLMPYQCEYCNKKFRFKTRLNLHVRQHTGAKPYTCVLCRRDFTNGSNYKKHMHRRHNIDTSVRKKNVVVTENTKVEPENQ